MAMRGHSSIQGSTDVATLYDLMPGYLPQPSADAAHETLDSYVEHESLPTGYWANFPKFIVSLLKAWYGRAATAANQYRFNWLPRIDGDYSQLPTFDRMSRGEMKGYFLFGQNPAGGGINAGLHRAGLRNLDWLVVLDWFPTESATFWKDDPGAPPPVGDQDRGLPPPRGGQPGERRLPDEHPAPAPVAHQGGRPARRLPLRRLVRLQPGQAPATALRRLGRAQGRAAPGPHLGLRLRRAAAPARRLAQPHRGRHRRREGPHGDQRLQGRRDRPSDRPAAAAEGVLRAEGRRHARRAAAGSTAESTRSPAATGPPSASRTGNPLQPDWGFAWPHNRRVLYNRASADPEGRPWSERKKLIWWDGEQRRWVGPDLPDFDPEKPPDYRPPEGATGMARPLRHRAVHLQARRPRLAVRPRRRQGRAPARPL